MNRNKGKITLSLAIAATLTLTSAPVFADTNIENTSPETSITENVSSQGGQTTPTQEPVVNTPFKLDVMGSETTTSPAIVPSIDTVTSLGVEPNHTFTMNGINNMGRQEITVTYASGKSETVELKPENFSNFDISKAYTAPCMLTYGGKSQMVNIKVPLPQKEISKVKQIGIPYVMKDVPKESINLSAMYNVEFKDGTSCTAMLSAFNIKGYFGYETHRLGLTSVNIQVNEASIGNTFMIVTDSSSDIGKLADLKLDVSKFKRQYRLNENFDRSAMIDIYDGDVRVGGYEVMNTAISLRGFNSETVGTRTATLSLCGMFPVDVEYTVSKPTGVYPKRITGFNTQPTDAYEIGDEFDREGSIDVLMSDGSTKEVPLTDSGVSIVGFETGFYGNNKIAFIHYEGLQITLNFDVVQQIETREFADFDPAYGYTPGGDNMSYTVEVGDKITVPVVFKDGSKGRLPLTAFSQSDVLGDLDRWSPYQVGVDVVKDGKKAKLRIDKTISPDRIKYISQNEVRYNFVDENVKFVRPSGTFTIQLFEKKIIEIDTQSIPPINIEGLETELPDGKTAASFYDKPLFTTMSIGNHEFEMKYVLTNKHELNQAIYISPVSSMTIVDATLVYKIGDKFDGKGRLVASLEDGGESSTPLRFANLPMTGFDTSTAGEKTVTITYRGKTVTYKITVTGETSGGGSSSGGSSSSGGGSSSTTSAKPADTKPATPTQADTKPAIKDATQVGQGETKLTKFNKITAENIKQINGFFVPANKVVEGTALPSDIKAIVVEGKKPAFKDVAKHWAASSINEAVERGLLNGMSETSFQPKAPLTAEQTFAGLSNVLIKNNILNVKIDKNIVKEKLSSQFSNPTWSTLAVAQVLSNTNPGMVDRYSEAQSLKETMTRGDMANVIYALGHDVFPNNAKNAEEFCKELGIMVGDKNGNFASERILSRAELSSILLRIDDKLAQL